MDLQKDPIAHAPPEILAALAHELLNPNGESFRLEDMMHRLFPVFVREFNFFTRECVKWTLVGILFLVSLWLLTDGLPRVVAVINGGTR